MNNEYFYSHERRDRIKWVVAFTLIFILIAGVAASIALALRKEDKQETVTPPAEENFIVTPDKQSGLKLTAMRIAETSSPDEEAYEVTATVTPEDADDKALSWETSFVNPSSEWATGKTVTDYVTVSPEENGKAKIKLVAPFGEKIALKAYVTNHADVSATATLDYLARIEKMKFFISKTGDTEFCPLLEFTVGDEEVMYTYTVPDYEPSYSDAPYMKCEFTFNKDYTIKQECYGAGFSVKQTDEYINALKATGVFKNSLIASTMDVSNIGEGMKKITSLSPKPHPYAQGNFILSGMNIGGTNGYFNDGVTSKQARNAAIRAIRTMGSDPQIMELKISFMYYSSSVAGYGSDEPKYYTDCEFVTNNNTWTVPLKVSTSSLTIPADGIDFDDTGLLF